MFDVKTIEHLKYYVYLLIDPVTDEPFYVGKGIGNRVFNHVEDSLKSSENTDKFDVIRRIHSQGHKVKHLIVRHGLNEKTAFEIESTLIDTFKLFHNLAIT